MNKNLFIDKRTQMQSQLAMVREDSKRYLAARKELKAKPNPTQADLDLIAEQTKYINACRKEERFLSQKLKL